MKAFRRAEKEVMLKYSIFKRIIPVLCMLVVSIPVLVACTFHNPAPTVGYSSAQAKRIQNVNGIYRVRAGDTMFGIAFDYGLDQRELARWNDIDEPFTIYPDQILRLTAPSQTSPGTAGVKIYKASTPQATSTRTYTTRDVPPAAATQKPVPPAAVTNSPKAKPPATSAEAVSTPAPASKPASSGAKPPASTATSKPVAEQSEADPGSWRWPTQGRLLHGFVAGDPARNGIDIAGKEGQAIKASASGTVVYSGNGLIGYGELIIIKHSDNMLSAYAHNKVRLAKEGQQVVAGETIAQMGRNDRNEQILHFEIRTRGKPVNPLTYLPRQ